MKILIGTATPKVTSTVLRLLDLTVPTEAAPELSGVRLAFPDQCVARVRGACVSCLTVPFAGLVRVCSVTIDGDVNIARYLARANPAAKLYEGSALMLTQVRMRVRASLVLLVLRWWHCGGAF